MNDNQIRIALKRKLFAQYFKDSETLILDEVGIRHGAARIDIAVINGILHGFEIKSNQDTLKRLRSQVLIYNSVFDRVTLVVGDRYTNEVLNIVPLWWGIKVAQMRPSCAIDFLDLRQPSDNPSPNALAIAKLLWRDEALAILVELGKADKLKSRPRAEIYTRLSEVLVLNSLRTRVYQQLKCRTGWRSAERQTSCDG